MDKAQAVFLPRHATSWVKMLDLARLLAEDGRLTPVMLLATEEMAARLPECRAAGVEAVDISAALTASRDLPAGPLGHLMNDMLRRQGWIERLAECLPVAAIRMALLRRRLLREYDVFRTALARIRPAVLLAPGDRELSPVPPALRAAKDLQIPIVIAAASSPYTEGLVQARERFLRFQLDWRRFPPLLNMLVRWLFPAQALAVPRGSLLFSPGWLTLTLASAGMLSRNPWVQGAGNSDFHLQHSKQRMEDFIRLGSPAERMVFVGDTALDALHRNLLARDSIRAGMVARYGLDEERSIMIISVPNDAEHGVCGWEEHIERLDRYFAAACSTDINILLSLHPKAPPDRYRGLAARHNLPILSERLYNALPAADLYVCSGSSTVLWAQLCGMPVINLDYLKVRDIDFVGAEGIINVETPAEFVSILRKWRIDPGIFGNIEKRQVHLAEDCLFDGNAGDRICAFLSHLHQRPAGAALNTARKSAA